ncbi:GNAT family N-acetyltransferase [Actinophytocola sp. NPDC049390]|uniref:bifunctional acetate--CoA ligase family protein/GNAT family N-acetyltransferase n=1 Tax=Actinophytocola sp. NPDC049390 TaxID=3363894 RepID=UPI0037AD3905
MTATTGVRALLADGRIVVIRAIDVSDAADVLALHTRLSEHDRYLRFFGSGKSILDAITRRIARTADDSHAAVGAWLGGKLVGVAHYERTLGSTTAEVALVVDGAVQARGLGTLLLEHLGSAARRRGITRFVAEVLAENQRMIKVFADAGLPYRMSSLGPERHVEIWLTENEVFAAAVDERDRVADVASLANVLRPSSIVVVGAGRRPDSVGHAVLRNLLDGGFSGKLTAVNPHADEIAGVPCRPSIAELTEVPDLAVVCVPAPTVPDAVEECGREGIPAVVVISAGLSGTDLADRVVASIRRHGMRLVGPNCIGVANTATGMNATFMSGAVPEGDVGIVTQSGGVGIAVVELLRQLGLGVSTMVSTGDKYDISGNDMLLWWRHDQNTAAAVLYLESFGNPRKFSRLARGLARTKPVLAVRSAESDVAQRAAASHTAAAATPAVTRDALFEQAGVIAVDTVSEVVDVLTALAWQPLPGGNRVAILSNAGGAGVLAADACVHNGLLVPRLAESTRAALAALLPTQASTDNPIDTTAAVNAATFAACLDVLLADGSIDAVLAVGVPTAVADPVTAAPAIARERRKTVLVVRPGQLPSVIGLGDEHDPAPATASYADPAAAAAALSRMATYARWRARPAGDVGTPDDVRLDEARALVREFLRAEPHGGWLAPATTMRLLTLFGIPAVPSIQAGDVAEAVAALRELGGPVAVKVIAAGVLHKARAGGVALNVATEADLRTVWTGFRDRFGDAMLGVLVQPMAEPGRELIVGVDSDETFGPLVVFGLGGTDTDLIADRAARLTPLSDVDAEEMVHGLRSSAMLFGGDRPLPTDGLVDVLVRTSALADAIPEVTELDLNPVVVRVDGCQVLDARVRIAPREPSDPFLRRLRA